MYEATCNILWFPSCTKPEICFSSFVLSVLFLQNLSYACSHQWKQSFTQGKLFPWPKLWKGVLFTGILSVECVNPVTRFHTFSQQTCFLVRQSFTGSIHTLEFRRGILCFHFKTSVTFEERKRKNYFSEGRTRKLSWDFVEFWFRFRPFFVLGTCIKKVHKHRDRNGACRLWERGRCLGKQVASWLHFLAQKLQMLAGVWRQRWCRISRNDKLPILRKMTLGQICWQTRILLTTAKCLCGSNASYFRYSWCYSQRLIFEK